MSFRALLSLALVAVSSGTIGLAPEGPVVVFRTGSAAEVANDDDVAMSLAVGSLSPEERTKLLGDLGNTTARLEARLSPLADDLGDEDVAPLDELERDLAPRMAAVTAARGLTRTTNVGAGLSVRVASSCAEARVQADETCASLWDERDDRPLARRARFVAWAAARAAVVQFSSTTAMQRCAENLRPRTTAAGSSVALVVTNTDPTPAERTEREQLRDAAKQLGRAMHANHLRDDHHLDALAHEAPTRSPLPLRLGPATLVVVPRLSSLTNPHAVTAEIESACGSNNEWIHRP
jgi:hypothetical protein